MVRFRTTGAPFWGGRDRPPLQFFLTDNCGSIQYAIRASGCQLFRRLRTPATHRNLGQWDTGFLGITNILRSWLKEDETGLDSQIAFLCLHGPFPCPDSDMLLLVSLPDAKKDIWDNRIGEFLTDGLISNKEPE